MYTCIKYTFDLFSFLFLKLSFINVSFIFILIILIPPLGHLQGHSKVGRIYIFLIFANANSVKIIRVEHSILYIFIIYEYHVFSFDKLIIINMHIKEQSNTFFIICAAAAAVEYHPLTMFGYSWICSLSICARSIPGPV